jgi:uncharacterized OB-fold protein
VPRISNMPEFLAEIEPDAWTAPYWQAAAEHRLVAAKCGDCGAFRVPPAPFCWNCRSQVTEWPQLSGHGTVYTYTVIRRAVIPQIREVVPYVVAVIELDDAPGARLVGNVLDVDPDDVRIGLAVTVAWDDIRPGLTIPRWVARA